MAKQTALIKKLADQGSCVIVGRNANVILEDKKPLRIFVYAELDSRIARCKQRETENPGRTDKDYERQIKEVDRLRARNHDMLCSYRWGDMRGYDLCLNTSYLEIKKVIPSVAEYTKQWFAK